MHQARLAGALPLLDMPGDHIHAFYYYFVIAGKHADDRAALALVLSGKDKHRVSRLDSLCHCDGLPAWP